MNPELAELLIAIILCVFTGGALGNYATSFVHRLPVKEPVFDRNPFCASCNTYLQPRDLVPLVSYLWNRGKCRYCSVHIPPVHFIVEVVSVAIVISAYFTLGLGEPFILMLSIGILWLILAMIAIRSNYVEPIMVYWLVAIVTVLRVLVDSSLYPAFFSGLVLVMLMGYLHHKKKISLEMAGICVLTAIALPWVYALFILCIAYLFERMFKAVYKRDMILVPFLSGIGVYTALLLSF